MKDDPKIQELRAAFDAARFDERTTDERGFADRFEKEFKPLLKAAIPDNLRKEAARRVRKWVAIAMFGAIAVGFFPLSILLNALDEDRAAIVFYVMVSIFAVGSGWLLKARRKEPHDPIQLAVVSAVLERFGCKMGDGASMYHPLRSGAPILPSYTEFVIPSEHLSGRFDGRTGFNAVRVRAMRRQGKKSEATFRGWYLRIDLPFSFSGRTIVRDLVADYKIPDDKGLKTVSLESSEFERRFVVLADDQVEARMILSPDVMHHLTEETKRLEPEKWGFVPAGPFLMGFAATRVHVWLPCKESALSDWTPLEPSRLIEDIHEAFAELAAMRAFLRDIDVITESEGFRAQAAKNARSVEGS